MIKKGSRVVCRQGFFSPIVRGVVVGIDKINGDWFAAVKWRLGEDVRYTYEYLESVRPVRGKLSIWQHGMFYVVR